MQRVRERTGLRGRLFFAFLACMLAVSAGCGGDDHPAGDEESVAPTAAQLEADECVVGTGDPRCPVAVESLPEDGYLRFRRAQSYASEAPSRRVILSPVMVDAGRDGEEQVGVHRRAPECTEESPITSGLKEQVFLFGNSIWALERRFRNLGYRVEVQAMGEVDYWLKPYVVRVDIDTCGPGWGQRSAEVVSSVEVEMRFDLLSDYQNGIGHTLLWQKVVSASFEGPTPNEDGAGMERAVANAFFEAADQLLADPEFLAFLDPELSKPLLASLAQGD